MDNYSNKGRTPQSYAVAQQKNMQALPKDAMQSFPRPVTEEVHKPTHEEIAIRAHQIYIRKGMPQGQSDQIWQQAERELLRRASMTHGSR